MTAPPERAVSSSTGQYLAMEKEKGGGCLHFDAKMIRHAWHYSWLCSWRWRGGGGGGHNWSLASECHQTRSREVEGQKCSTCHPGSRTPHLYAPAKRRPKIVRCKVKNKGSKISLQDVHATPIWLGDVSTLTLQCHMSQAVQQEAHLSVLMRAGTWKVGVGGVCNSHMLSPPKAAIEVDKEREKRGVMIMPQLMEISCPGWGAGGPGGLGCGCTDDTEALAPVFRNAAAFRRGEIQQVHPCFSVVRV